jgi:hypothetical protein
MRALALFLVLTFVPAVVVAQVPPPPPPGDYPQPLPPEGNKRKVFPKKGLKDIDQRDRDGFKPPLPVMPPTPEPTAPDEP